MQTSDLLLDAYGRIRDLVHRSTEGLDADSLTFRPAADANSIAWLVWHLTRIQDDHISEIAESQQAWVGGPWAAQLGMAADPTNTGFGHTSAQVAAVQPPGPESLIGYHDDVAARTAGYVRTVTADEFDRVIDPSYDPPVTVGVRLISVISDNLQHAGQARYVRGIIERLQ